jgi:hypothetical protein
MMDFMDSSIQPWLVQEPVKRIEDHLTDGKAETYVPSYTSNRCRTMKIWRYSKVIYSRCMYGYLDSKAQQLVPEHIKCAVYDFSSGR